MPERQQPKEEDLGVNEVTGGQVDELNEMESGLMVTHQQVRDTYLDGTVDAFKRDVPSSS